MFTHFTPADLVAILNSVNIPVCFTVLVAGAVIISIKRAFQRAEDANRRVKHGRGHGTAAGPTMPWQPSMR
jgi:hypothetical protein